MTTRAHDRDQPLVHELAHANGPSDLEKLAVVVARLAAAHVRRCIGSATSDGTKSSPTDVVTTTDIETEQLIRAQLEDAVPGSAFVGEELADEAGQHGVGWIIDPIDGTVNFLYDLPVMSVSIAATIDGQIVAGAVADVHRDEIFSASLHGGACCDGVPITTSSVENLADALVATGFSYDSALRTQQAAVVSAVLPTARDIRCMGSAALNLCWVACGRMDAYYERDLKPYDHAAGGLIASEAGALVDVPAEGHGDLVLAASPEIYEPLSSLVTPPSD